MIDRLPLILFGGMVEVPFCTNKDLISLFPIFKSFLSTCNPDNLFESVDILNFYIKERIFDEEVDLFKTACRLLLPHWDTDHTRVLESVLTFFGHIFNLIFTSRLSESFTKWVQSAVIETCILGAPFCSAEPIILTKGSIRLIDVLVRNAPLSWVFERSPYLMTSLLLALAWNYSASLAGDVINFIIEYSQGDVNNWLQTVLIPLANFLLHGVISCSAEQQLKYLPGMDHYEAAKLRLQNFIHRCFKEPLANLPIGDLYREPQDPLSMWQMPFIQEIVNQLVMLLNVSSLFLDFRLTSFVNLLPLLSYDKAVQITQENPKLVETALSHSSDRIRSDMCSTLSKLILKIPFTSELRSELYCWLFEGVKSLLISADPTARSTTNRSFFVAAQQIRNRCATCSLKELDNFLVQGWTGVNGYPSCKVEYLGRAVNSPLGALVDVYRFASTLWSDFASRPDVCTHVPITGLSPFMIALLSRPFLPPGMPYQRQKMLILLVSSMFKLSVVENSKTKGVNKSGFELCTAKNLQLIIDHLSDITGFPSLVHRETWLQLIASLPNVNSEIQVSLLDILTTYWPESTPEWFTEVVQEDLYHLAETWSNSHLPEVYTAGANLFQWLFTVANETTANQLASKLLENIKDGCKESSASDHEDDLSQRISETPIHGFLIAADNILFHYGKQINPRIQFPQPVFNSSVDRTVFSRLGELLHPRLAQYCLQLSNECLSVMGVSKSFTNYEGSTLSHLVAGCEASSFEILGQSVLELALQTQRKTMSDQETPKHMDDDIMPIELSSHYKRILSWSWYNLKLTSSILVKWVYFRVCMAFSSGEKMDDIVQKLLSHVGKQLIGILMACRHRGLVESIFQCLRDYLTISAYLNQYESVGSLKQMLIQPEQVIEVCLLAVKVGKFSVTRRAAGLWPAVKAVLVSEIIVSLYDQPLLYRWLCEMLRISSLSIESPDSDVSEKCDSPRALTLHLMKGVLEDARLGPVAFALSPPPGSDNWLTALFCDAVLPNFSHGEWTVANGSLQLFATIVKRLIGPLYTRPGTSVAEVFGCYPRLFHTFVNILSDPLTQKSLTRNRAVPLLGLLSRLKPSSDAAFSDESSARMVDCLQSYLSHPVAQIRYLAAKSLVAFIPLSPSRVTDASFLPSGGPCGIFEEELLPSSALKNPKGANMISGQLLSLVAWIERAPTSSESTARAKMIAWPRAIEVMNKWTGPDCRHWYLATHLARLMRCVFKAIPLEDKVHYCKHFHKHYNFQQWKDCSNDVPTEALFPMFHSELYDLYYTMHEFKPLFAKWDNNFINVPDTPQHADVLFHLLSNSNCGVYPDLGDIVLGNHTSACILSQALNGCRIQSKDEAEITKCLEILSNTDDKSRIPGILLAMAPKLSSLHNIEMKCKFTNWWLENLRSCLSIEAAGEQSRLQAAKALLEWLNPIKQFARENITGSHETTVLDLLFSGLFDESTEVRQLFGQGVGKLFGLQYPVCTLKGVDIIISNLEKLTPNPTEWLFGFARNQLEAIVGRAKILHEHRIKNACYEPDCPNPYFDVFFTFGVIADALRRYSADNTSLIEGLAKSLEQVCVNLANKNDLRSATLIFNSPSLHQVALMQQLITYK
nr:thyroid adenoma associated [Hymenolepis microstoma]